MNHHLGCYHSLSRLRLLFLAALLLCGLPAFAHVGSPNVFFEGKAGPYAVHVIIHPAEVIPGLAEISVRVENGHPKRIAALPIKWNVGRKGAPPPDIARLVRGETNLYSAQLWLMEGGAQTVELEIEGDLGSGRVSIPVDAVARRVLPMPLALGLGLAAAGLLLLSLLVTIIGAAVRESIVEPGMEVPARKRWWARGAMAATAVLLAVLLFGGKHWWDLEAADYRNNRLYQPIDATAKVRLQHGGPVLRLEVNDVRFARNPPLVPDHGKLMHLFLIREPRPDAFAHLHPVKRDRKTFDCALPVLPTGTYRVYADVTYETGFSDTIVTQAEIPSTRDPNASTSTTFDPDDSWRVASESQPSQESNTCDLGSGLSMTWANPSAVRANEPLSLAFTIHDRSGHEIRLEPYLGMRGHLALCRDDGAVFTHLHPGGTASMAAMQLATLRAEGKLPLEARFGADDPICKLPAVGPREAEWISGIPSAHGSSVSFPYAFPKPGHYRLWVQVKIEGKIQTGVFDATVSGT